MPLPDALPFFFYGTLLDADVRALVLPPPHGAARLEPATLAGYRRVRMRRRHYPVIVPNHRAVVAGCLAHGIGRDGARRLFDFETGEYRATIVVVTTALGVSVRALVFRAGARAMPSVEPWELEPWRRRHKRAFLRRMRGTGEV